MSTRLGIIEAFQETLDLCWRRLPALIRISWAPSLLLLIIVYALLIWVMPDIPAVPNGPDGKPDPEALRAAGRAMAGTLLPVFGILTLVSLAVWTMIAVPISRLAGAGEEPEGFVFVRWSGRHTRFAGAIVLQGIVTVAFTIAVLVALVASGQVEHVLHAREGAQAAPADQILVLRDLQKLQLAQFGSLVLASVAFTTFAPIAAIENRLRLFGALGTGLRHFFPILAGYFLLFVAGIALLIAANILYFVAALVMTTLVSALKPTLTPTALIYVSFFLSLVLLAANFVFNVFYQSLGIAYPAIVYKRLSSGE